MRTIVYMMTSTRVYIHTQFLLNNIIWIHSDVIYEVLVCCGEHICTAIVHACSF